MLKKFKQLFESAADTSAPKDDEVKLAAATLMFELIRADGDIDDVEIEQLRMVLGNHFQMGSADVETLIDDAQNSAQEAISLQGFTRQICDHWGNEERVKLLEYLWLLALADQHIDTHERHLVRKVAGLLYLTDRQINVARENAKQQLDIATKL